MDDRLRETLSAMMDDEADELAVRRLLSHAGQDEVRSQWQRWQHVRDLMHEGRVPAESVDVSAGVRKVLDGNPSQPMAVPAGTSRPVRYWHWPAAAMVALALVVGFGVGAGWETDASQEALLQAGVQSEPATSGGSATGASVPEVALQGLDEEQWEQVSRYLLEHAQHNSVGAGRGAVGYARLVSATGPAY